MKNMDRYLFLLILGYLTSESFAGYIPPGPRFRCPTEDDKLKLLHPCVCNKGSDAGIYVTCKNTGLATLSVGLGNVAFLKLPIEELVLEECNIAKLYGPLFHKLDIRILRIKKTPIKLINEDVFYGVNRTLQEFHLMDSELEEFPKHAFEILGNLSVLQIDKHNIDKLNKDIFAGSSASGKLEKLHFTNGKLTELNPESFQPLRKLKTLDIHGNQLKTLKKNQFKGLRDVEVLDLSFNNITKLDSSHIGDLTKLTWCNISHNLLGEMARSTFARNTILKVLNMEHNKLKKLDTNSLRGMRLLRRLFLSDNEISEIGRGIFESVARIGIIDLARNKIKKIDYQMFSGLKYTELIDVSENQITEIQKFSFRDLYLTKINISHNFISKIEAGSFENCVNITVLDLSHNNLTHIIPKAFDTITYATELQLSYNHFTSLNQIPMHNMTGLKVLNVSNNEITSIPKNSFPKLYELHTVDLSYNQLSDIFNSVFQTLFSLRFLNLSHNAMEQIKPTTFGTLPTLLEIDLSHNLLKDVARSSLVKLASCRKMDVSHNMLEKIFTTPISLGELDISYNNISEISENTWPTMNALLKVDLSYNPLQNGLSSSSFQGLLTLQTLVLTETGLTRPPWEALNPLTSLQYLKLNKNYLTELKKSAFGRLPIVFDLDLSDNQISKISVRAFDGLLQLLSLSLRNNQLYHIPNEAFFGLVSLRSLDLSQNFIEKLDNKTNGIFDDCLSLERLNLSYNKISFITRKTFPSNPYIPYKIKVIDLSHNVMPVITADLMYGTKKMEVLNISNNILNDIRKGVIGNLTSLKILDLSGNNLNDLTSDKYIFKLPSDIREVYLSNNELLKLPIKHLYSSENLTVLDVRNNSLEFFDEELVDKMKNKKFHIHFSGNPLNCDCFSRPLKHYLNRLSKENITESIYSDILCFSPPSLANSRFIDISDDRLNCIENVAIRQKLDEKSGQIGPVTTYDVESDLIFREKYFAQNGILVQWYVQTSKDLADFHVIIRDPENNIYFSRTVTYNERHVLVNFAENAKLKSAIDEHVPKLELCVLASDSISRTSNWFESQCAPLPNNFEYLPKMDLMDKLSDGKSKFKTNRSRKILRSESSVFNVPSLGVLLFGCALINVQYL